MTQRDLSANISAAFRALGTGGGAMAIFGKYTAFPHGSIQPQQLREGDMVLIDDGCSVEGYQSDITRTTVFGKPTKRQREVWDLERKAQDAALAAAKPGATCESVDAAARKVITDAGFGPGYKTPGLPHRTGHGIGLDGHEWTYLVKGNKTKMEPGMCFSNEPTIVDLRRVRRASGRLHVHHAERRAHVHQAESRDRSAVRIGEEMQAPQTTETSPEIYRARIAKLQEAMKEFGLQAIVLESGPAMMYLTGVRWGRSERTFAVVFTQKGDPAWVLPGFEEMRARELIQRGTTISACGRKTRARTSGSPRS